MSRAARAVALSSAALLVALFGLGCSVLVTGCSGDKEGTNSSSKPSSPGSERSNSGSAGSSSANKSTATSTSDVGSRSSNSDEDSSADEAGTTSSGKSRVVGTVNPTAPSGPNPLLAGDPAKYKMMPRTNEEKKAAAILNTLEALVDAKKDAEALRRAEEASKIAPNFPPVWYAVGVLNAEIDKGSSFAALKRAVELDPYYYTAWGTLGVLYERENRFAEAGRIFKHMTEIAPASEKVWVSLGEMYLECNRAPDAEAALRRAIEINPKSPGGWYYLGYMYHGTRRADGSADLAEAERCYKKAIASEPKLVQAYLHLGVLCRSQGRLKEAEQFFRKLTQIAPDYAPGWRNLASVLEQKGDTAGAKKVLAQGRKFNPLRKSEVLLEKASEALSKRDFAKARKYAIEARRSELKWYRPWFALGKIALEENKLDEAVRFFQGAIECDKTAPESYNLMGCALAYQGKMLQARKAFEKCVELEPNNAMFMANLSESLRETDGDKRRARLLAKRAERLDPQDPHVVTNAAKFLLIDGLVDQAIEKLEYVLKLDPNYTTAWSHLGVAYVRKKDGDRAVMCLKKATEVDKDNTEAWKNLAELYRMAGDKKAEAEALKNSLKAQSGNTAEGLYSVAYKLEKLGQKSSASEALKQGLDMDPAEADVLLNVPYVEDQHKDDAIFSAPPDLLRKRGRSD